MDRAASSECSNGANADWAVGVCRDEISWYTISRVSDATITIAICVDSLFSAPIMLKNQEKNITAS